MYQSQYNHNPFLIVIIKDDDQTAWMNRLCYNFVVRIHNITAYLLCVDVVVVVVVRFIFCICVVLMLFFDLVLVFYVYLLLFAYFCFFMKWPDIMFSCRF